MRPAPLAIRALSVLFLFVRLVLLPMATAQEITKIAPDKVKLLGSIEYNTHEKLRPLLEGVHTLVIESQGGSLEGGLKLGQLILEKNLDIVVENNCHSACAYGPFAAANHRTVLPGAAVCFHGGFFKNADDWWDRVGGKEAYRQRYIENKKAALIKGFNKLPSDKQKTITDYINQMIPNAPIDQLLDSERTFNAAKSADKDIDERTKDFEQSEAKFRRDMQALYDAKNLKLSIIDDSRYIYISPPINALIGKMEIDPYKVAWCPSPDELRRYGYNNLEMWYPQSEEELFKLGEDGVFSRYHYDPSTGQPNEPGSRHIEAKTFASIDDPTFEVTYTVYPPSPPQTPAKKPSQ